MKLKISEIYKNQMLFGPCVSSTNQLHIKNQNIIKHKSGFVFFKEKLFVKTLYKAIKNIDFNLNTLIYCSIEPLQEMVISIAQKNNWNYLVKKWSLGLISNKQLLVSKINTRSFIIKMMDETVNKKTLSVLKHQLFVNENLTKGFKDASNIKQVICIGPCLSSFAKECSENEVKLIATVGANENPKNVDYPIYCNNENLFTLKKILQIINDEKRNHTKT